MTDLDTNTTFEELQGDAEALGVKLTKTSYDGIYRLEVIEDGRVAICADDQVKDALDEIEDGENRYGDSYYE